LKIALGYFGSFAQVGLAFATSIGAWVNLSLLTVFAKRQGFAVSGAGLKPVAKLFIAGAILIGALFFGERVLTQAFAGLPYFREEMTLGVLLVFGALIYALLVWLLLGRGWLRSLLQDVGSAADKPAKATLEQPDPLQDSAALPDNTPPPNV